MRISDGSSDVCSSDLGRRRVAHAPAGVLRLPDMDPAGEEGAGGEHHRGRLEAQAGVGERAAHAVVPAAIGLDQQVVDGGLEDGEVRLRLHGAPDVRAIQTAVGLAARRAHRRPLRRVEPAPLDAGGVGGLRSEEHTSELQSLMRISYAVFCLKKKKTNNIRTSYIKRETAMTK